MKIVTTKYTCDRCGHETKQPNSDFRIGDWDRYRVAHYSNHCFATMVVRKFKDIKDYESEPIMLCNDCRNELEDWWGEGCK